MTKPWRRQPASRLRGLLERAKADLGILARCYREGTLPEWMIGEAIRHHAKSTGMSDQKIGRNAGIADSITSLCTAFIDGRVPEGAREGYVNGALTVKMVKAVLRVPAERRAEFAMAIIEEQVSGALAERSASLVKEEPDISCATILQAMSRVSLFRGMAPETHREAALDFIEREAEMRQSVADQMENPAGAVSREIARAMEEHGSNGNGPEPDLVDSLFMLAGKIDEVDISRLPEVERMRLKRAADVFRTRFDRMTTTLGGS